MKVLHIIDSGGLYGAEVMLLNLMSAQKKKGIESVMISIGSPSCAPKPIEIKADILGLKVIPLRMKPGLNFPGSWSIFKLAKKENATLLHSHGYKGNILLGLLTFGFRRIPLVTTLHGWTWTGKFNRMMIYELLDALSLRCVDHVVFVNKMMGKHNRLRSLSSKSKTVINNGIEPVDPSIDRMKLSAQILDFCNKRFTIVAVGRFSQEKGFLSLIRVVADLVENDFDLQLLLMGDGYLRDEFVAEAKRMGIVERVFMPGYVENVQVYFKHCQLFVMPSLTEGLPMALLEAMSSEIPIIASHVGGIPDALHGGNGGILINPDNHDDLKEAISRIYVKPEGMIDTVKFAKKRVDGEFSSTKMMEKYQLVYHKVLS